MKRIFSWFPFILSDSRNTLIYSTNVPNAVVNEGISAIFWNKGVDINMSYKL